MFDLKACLDNQLRDIRYKKPTVMFPEADDSRVIIAASRLIKFANIVLTASREDVESLIKQHNLEDKIEGSINRFFSHIKFIIPAQEENLRKEFVKVFIDISKGKKWEISPQEAEKLMCDPVYFSIMATRLGYADAVLGGVTHTSRDFFRPCLRLLPKKDVVYEMGLFALPDDHPPTIYKENIVMFADVALNPVPTPLTLAEIAIGACRTLRDLIPVDVLPEINGALLSYSTRGSGEGPSVERVRDAAKIIPGLLARLKRDNPIYETIHIEAELQISVAINERAALSKLKDDVKKHPAIGKSNVLIAPNLDVGNLLYHIYATRFPHSQSLLIIGGLDDSALDFSRSSTPDEIVLGAKALILRYLKSSKWKPTPKDYFFPRYNILAINPGSTSTKVAFYYGEEIVFSSIVRHSSEELAKYNKIQDQHDLRTKVVKDLLKENKITSIDAVVSRGGLLRPLKGGTYIVDQNILDDLKANVNGEHASNLGASIADEIAEQYGCKAYIVDPVVVDELDDRSRITGLPGIKRQAVWHALNQRAAAKRYAEGHGKEYEKLNLIIAHLGGGISVGAHKGGKCIYVKDALYDGPIMPERSGTLPMRKIIDLCYKGLSKQEIEKQLIGSGGFVAHLGTSDLREVEKMIENGNQKAKLLLDTMIEQIAMEISSVIPKFNGLPVDQIIITGGLAYSNYIVESLKKILSQIKIGITIYSGEDELKALRDGIIRIKRGHEEIKIYKNEINS